MNYQEHPKKKITALKNNYMKEQMRNVQYMQKRTIYRRRRLAIIFFVAIIIFALVGLNLFHNYQKLTMLENTSAQITKEYEEVSTKKEKLEATVALLQDEEYVAKLARKKYFLSKEGETIYRYPGSEAEISEEN